MDRPIAVAGHICLDVIPAMSGVGEALRPGALVHIGPAQFATGGTVANVGLALHRLGMRPRLIGKIGDDLFGQAILDILGGADPELAAGMARATGEPTSYSVVISAAASDRIFLHCPGVNDTFGAADVADGALDGVRVLHFGYPPLMRRMYLDDGRELAELLGRAKDRGVTTSLDMARPDPQSEAGRVDWPGILRRALPFVDLFLPSAEELLFMLDRPRFDAGARLDTSLLARLAVRCLEMGAAMVGLKLGDQGLYLRTTADTARLDTMGRGRPANLEAWRGRELLAPCFEAAVAGTTGSGDATIAGLLAALLADEAPEDALLDAVGVGACSVEAVDATSGIPSWEAVRERIRAGWRQAALMMVQGGDGGGWRWDERARLWHGAADGVVS
ncbi:MAG TPA: carbohydrate kinase family protein [Ktedonobacterales bacterium]